MTHEHQASLSAQIAHLHAAMLLTSDERLDDVLTFIEQHRKQQAAGRLSDECANGEG